MGLHDSTEAQVKRVGIRTFDVQQQCAHNGVVYEYDFVDEQPQFPGGERGLTNFINNTREYPYQAFKKRIQGRVICSFVVNTDGTLSHIHILKGCDSEELNNEALRIIKAMPSWKTGKIAKEPVAVRCILPIVFRL